MRLVEAHADALVIVGRDGPALLRGGIRRQAVDDVLPIGAEILGEDVHAELMALGGLGEVGDEGFERIALLFAARQLNEQTGDEIRAVVQEVILLQRAVPGLCRRNSYSEVAASSPINPGLSTKTSE